MGDKYTIPVQCPSCSGDQNVKIEEGRTLIKCNIKGCGEYFVVNLTLNPEVEVYYTLKKEKQ